MHKTTAISETPLFRGPENDPIPLKEQKKIQIDIRRHIPSSKACSGPIKRSIKDPLKVLLPRREKEGRKGLFDRDEIKSWRKVMPPVGAGTVAGAASLPLKQQEVVALRPDPMECYEKKKRAQDDLRERLHQEQPSSRRKSSIHSRLGLRIQAEERPVLGRQELERFRPDVKPWDVNPEFVPRGRNYYEHDTREDEYLIHNSSRGRFNAKSSRDRGRGYTRSRPYDNRSSGGPFRRSRRDPVDAMEWKHDRYSGERDFHR
uniref:Putative LOC100742483 [Bombus impatiens] n=1 Tax=Lepeophtheirus salmonis TaxID=72036 RepID=A0A0K2TT85_LEPSM